MPFMERIDHGYPETFFMDLHRDRLAPYGNAGGEESNHIGLNVFEYFRMSIRDLQMLAEIVNHPIERDKTESNQEGSEPRFFLFLEFKGREELLFGNRFFLE